MMIASAEKVGGKLSSEFKISLYCKDGRDLLFSFGKYLSHRMNSF
jgi:hypothetical protein